MIQTKRDASNYSNADFNILFVDDDELFLEEIQEGFERKNIHVFFASDLDSAIILAKIHKPRLVFCDQNLPDGLGSGAVSIFKKMLPNSKIVLFSGDSKFNLESTVAHTGAHAILEKPLSWKGIFRFITYELDLPIENYNDNSSGEIDFLLSKDASLITVLDTNLLALNDEGYEAKKIAVTSMPKILVVDDELELLDPMPKILVVDDELELLDPMPKILVVDDELELLDELKSDMEHAGYNIVTAASAGTALEKFSIDNQIGIVLTDINMPKMNGIEFINELKDKFSNSRMFETIFLTGSGGKDEVVDAIDLGAVAYISKPIIRNKLIDSIEKAREILDSRKRSVQQIDQLNHDIESKSKLIDEKNANLEDNQIKIGSLIDIKREFLKLINHEFRTPLTNIVGMGALINSLSTETQIKGYSQNVISAGKRMEKLISTILDYISIGENIEKAYITTFSTEKLRTDIDSFFSEAAQNKGQMMCIYSDTKVLDVKADYAKTLKSIGLLVDNSVKFCAQDAQISIFFRTNNGCWEFEILDDGPGMTGSEIKMAIEPFRQIVGSDSKKQEGVGLGIPLAKRLIESQGGALNIKSTAPSGLSCRLTLPILD